MPPQTTDSDSVETVVIVQFLGRRRPIATAELYAKVQEPGVTPTMIDAAVEQLVTAGVLTRTDKGSIHPSAAMLKLDGLGMICV